MGTTTVSVAPAQAFPALREAIAALKGGSPLAPVTVVVATNATGVTARRWLGRQPGGVAATDMLTLSRVAELLGGPHLAAAGRRPVSTPVLELALGDLLANDPGAYGRVAQHPSTIVALRELHDELRLAGPSAPNRLAASSPRGRAAAEVSTRLATRLAEQWYDSADLLAVAADALRHGELPDRLRRVVVFLPRPLLGLEQGLLDALAERADVHVLTLDTDAVPDVAEARIVSATDADDEVRAAVRAVVDAARAGVPFGRMAIAWPNDQPYARLVEHHLSVAEVPWNGRPGRQPTERVVPRFVLDLLDVDRRGLRRTDLFDLLADLELHGPDGGRLPVARWERVSRRAGVAGGSDWHTRLAAYAASERARAAKRTGDDTHVPFAATDAEALSNYVRALQRALGPRDRTRPWAEWAAWCEAQIVERLGPTFLGRLPEAEQLAWQHTSQVLDRLASLDHVSERPVTRATFRAVFEAEFDAAPGRLGRIGEGVTVGSLAGMVGTDLDLAIVLGAADGLMPPQPSSGPLISDADRQAAGLHPSDARAERMRRGLLGLLGATPRTVVTYPRGDLRGTAERYPSRWLDAYLNGVEHVQLASHHAALLRTEFPAHVTEHRLRAGLAIGPEQLAPDDPALATALRVRSARRRPDVFTEYDGDLTGVTIEHFDQAVAPTRIEQWVACPHGYFMRYVLGVHPIDDPQGELEIPAKERGNVLHETLDALHREVLAGTLPQPTQGWQPEHRTRALELFDTVADHYEATGRTGRPASWAVERTRLRADLLGWLEADSKRLAATGATIVSSEALFGRDDPVHLTVPGPDGPERIAVYGFIDRIDRTSTGTLVVVDHKTGSKRKFADISPDDPTAAGTLFQLPAYAAGALALTGADQSATTVEAYYSFFGRERYTQVGYRLDADVRAEIEQRLADVVAGIRSGLFPARPAKPGFQLFVECHYCQPDALGTAERWAEWDRKRNDPRGRRWFAEPVDVVEEPA